MDDHGDSAAGATALPLGGSAGGRIDAVGDQDWFAVDLAAGEFYQFSAMPADGALADGLELSIVSPDGTTVFFSGDNADPGVIGAHLFYTAAASGTFYLRVAGAGAGDYSLAALPAEPLPSLAVGPGASIEEAAAGPVVAGSEVTISGAIDNLGFADAENVRVHFVISEDGSFDPGDRVFASTVIENVPWPSDGDTETAFSLLASLPEDIRDGEFLGMIIDPFDEIEEVLEGFEPAQVLQGRAVFADAPLRVSGISTDWTLSAGADVFEGYYDAETVHGLGGDDLIDGGRGGDTLFGGAGNDELIGGLGGDLLAGGGGDDVLRGRHGAGTDPAHGAGTPEDTGTDIAVFDGTRADFTIAFDGAAGSFTVTDIRTGGTGGTDVTFDIGVLRFDDRDVTVADLDPVTLAGGDGADMLTGAEGDDSLSGGKGNDSLDGGFGDDVLDGGGFSDTLAGGGGDDVLFGGDGADVLYGGGGDDRLAGGDGLDKLYGGAGADIFVMSTDDRTDYVRDFEFGIDRIDASAFGPIDFAEIALRDFGVWVEVLVGGPGGPHLMRITGPSDFTAADLGRSDFLLFGDDPDEPAGGPEPVVGTPGADTLDGTAAADFLIGQDGDDVLSGLGSGDTLFGDRGDDSLFGGDGDDLLDAGGFTDWLEGGAGDDILLGRRGSDRLFGGDGDDRLDGGAGLDRLTGGAGADIFVFASDDRTDYILDFETGTDRIDVSGLGGLGFSDLSISESGRWIEITAESGGLVHRVLVDGDGLTAGSFDEASFLFELSA